MSHELRTPLAGVYGAAMTLRRADVEFDDEQRNVLLDVIAAEAGRLARIVEDILSAGQLDANTLTLSLDRVEADTLAAEAIQAARLRFAEVAFDLTLDGTAVVRADRARLLQVLGNLIDNAVKYSPPSAPVDVAVLPVREHTCASRSRTAGSASRPPTATACSTSSSGSIPTWRAAWAGPGSASTSAASSSS